MRFGFIGFGLILSTAVILGFKSSAKKDYSDILIVIYALSILMTGFFSTGPFIEPSRFSLIEDSWHSIFASIAGVSFSIAILWHLLAYSAQEHKAFHLFFYFLVIGFSALVGLSKNDLIPVKMGLIQRGLYIVSFIWLWFRYIYLTRSRTI